MNADDAAHRWIDGWTRGWRDHDTQPIAALYTDDAVFVSAPNREHQAPAEYAAWAFAQEDAVELWFADPVVAEDAAAIPYWAVIRSAGREETLGGISHVRFRQDGCVAEQRDYWAMWEGRAEPPEGWGPVAAHAMRAA
jgi:hypothetical protein